MDHTRLCTWLGLPPGPWPPDHYALLGLPRGAGDFGDIEGRVLDRMELLRPHQLLQPDLVTEGMNRLAQALVCLTDPVARATYDHSLGIPPPPFEVVEDEAPPDPAGEAVEVPFQPGLAPPGEPQRPAYEVVWEPEPDPLPYDVVPEELPPAFEVVSEDEIAEDLPPAYEVVEDAPGRPKPPPLPRPLPLPPPRPRSPGPGNRRHIYRRLAELRRGIRAWEQLRPVFGTPAEALATPVAVLLFLRALAEARLAMPDVADVVDGADRPGASVAALARLPHALHVIRHLLPTQRSVLALDWRHGYDALVRERDRVRARARATRPHQTPDPVSRIWREFRRTPEWGLLVLGFAAILFAVLRRNS